MTPAGLKFRVYGFLYVSRCAVSSLGFRVYGVRYGNLIPFAFALVRLRLSHGVCVFTSGCAHAEDGACAVPLGQRPDAGVDQAEVQPGLLLGDGQKAHHEAAEVALGPSRAQACRPHRLGLSGNSEGSRHGVH